MSNDQIADHFIREQQLSFNSLRNVEKTEENQSFANTFNIDRIGIRNFKKVDKKGILKFLYDFLDEDDWGNDKSDFANLLDKYSEIHNQFGDNVFYLFSKNWFAKEDKEVLKPESDIYIYYFLIITIERKSKLLTVIEWKYD